VGLFDKLIRAMGIGNLKLTCNLDSYNIRIGKKRVEAVDIEGVAGEVEIKKVEIKLIQKVEQVRWNASTKKEERFTSENTIVAVEENIESTVKAGESTIVTFQIEISSELPVSAHPYSYYLKATADVPGLDSRCKQEVFII